MRTPGNRGLSLRFEALVRRCWWRVCPNESDGIGSLAEVAPVTAGCKSSTVFMDEPVDVGKLRHKDCVSVQQVGKLENPMVVRVILGADAILGVSRRIIPGYTYVNRNVSGRVYWSSHR